MARTKTAALALAVIALIAAFALVVGCSSSSSSSASSAQESASASASSAQESASASASSAQVKTLESYIAENQAEWDKEIAAIKESGGDILDVDITISGNKITQTMRYKQTYAEEEVTTLKDALDTEIAAQKATIEEQIKQLETATGVDGITWYFEYQNGDGKAITSFELPEKTA